MKRFIPILFLTLILAAKAAVAAPLALPVLPYQCNQSPTPTCVPWPTPGVFTEVVTITGPATIYVAAPWNHVTFYCPTGFAEAWYDALNGSTGLQVWSEKFQSYENMSSPGLEGFDLAGCDLNAGITLYMTGGGGNAYAIFSVGDVWGGYERQSWFSLLANLQDLGTISTNTGNTTTNLSAIATAVAKGVPVFPTGTWPVGGGGGGGPATMYSNANPNGTPTWMPFPNGTATATPNATQVAAMIATAQMQGTPIAAMATAIAQGVPVFPTGTWPTGGGGGGGGPATMYSNANPNSTPTWVPFPNGTNTPTPNATQVPLMIATEQGLIAGVETAVVGQQTAVAAQQTQEAAIVNALATLTPIVNQASFAITLSGSTPVTEVLPNMSFNTMSVNMWTGSGVTVFQAYISGGVTTAGSTAMPFWDSQNRVLQTTVLTNLKDTFFSSITGFQAVILDPNGSNTAIVYFSYGITDSAANHFGNAFSTYATAQPTANPTQGPLMLATVQAELNLQLTPIVAQATAIAAYATAIAQPTNTPTPNAATNNYPRVSELAVETAVSAQLTAVVGQGTPISPSAQATAVAANATMVANIATPAAYTWNNTAKVLSGTIADMTLIALTPTPVATAQAGMRPRILARVSNPSSVPVGCEVYAGAVSTEACQVWGGGTGIIDWCPGTANVAVSIGMVPIVTGATTSGATLSISQAGVVNN